MVMSIQSNIERGRSWMAGAARKFKRLLSGLTGTKAGRKNKLSKFSDGA